MNNRFNVKALACPEKCCKSNPLIYSLFKKSLFDYVPQLIISMLHMCCGKIYVQNYWHMNMKFEWWPNTLLTLSNSSRYRLLICDLILNFQHFWNCMFPIRSVDRRHTKKWRHHRSRDRPRASACRLERWGHHKGWAKEHSQWWKEELHWGSAAGCSQVLLACPLLPWQLK